MPFAVLSRNEETQVISYPEGTDPLYGYGSWDLVDKDLETHEDAVERAEDWEDAHSKITSES